jgi:hypothetical protein
VKPAIIIPFRDRGKDPCRPQNLERCLQWWRGLDLEVRVVDDGRDGDAQFNRSAAYNRGAAQVDADILIYVESDTLVPYSQIHQAVQLAASKAGMVVPFTYQKKLSSTDSMLVRASEKDPTDCIPEPHPYGENSNNGCANVLSRHTLELAGRWDETFDGHGHDDTAMVDAFSVAAGKTRWVDGPAYHLYHLDFDPDTTKDRSYLSDEDIAAQERNRRRLELYRAAKTVEEIRLLTSGQHTEEWLRDNWGKLNWKLRSLASENDPRAGRIK